MSVSEAEQSETPGDGVPEVGTLIRRAIAGSVDRIRSGLAKEGADITLEIDENAKVVVLELVRTRIVCEGCLLPQDLVSTLLTKDLRSDPTARALKFRVETRNWVL